MPRRSAALLLLLALVAGALAGCNTAEGFGRDLRHLGEAIEDAAED
jgi:predicted small secreted protein